MDVIDQQIVKLYIVRRLPQLDAAGEIGIDRKTISRGIIPRGAFSMSRKWYTNAPEVSRRCPPWESGKR